MASNTMPRCKYGLKCRIVDPKIEGTSKGPLTSQHSYKFQHPCFWVCKEGHPELGPPGVLCPLDPKLGPPCMASMIVPCTNMDPDHRRCFRHPEDDVVVEEVIDESLDDLDKAVLIETEPWVEPVTSDVSEEEGVQSKMLAAEAAADGDYAKAVLEYSKALAATPSALTFAKRAEALLKMGYPQAAAADCKRATEINPDSAKAYKVAAKALVLSGDFAEAYTSLCVGNKIDEDEDSAALQKSLKAKCDKIKKIGEVRAKRAAALFESLGLADTWTELQAEIVERYQQPSLESLQQWSAASPVSLKARLGELGVSEEQRESLFTAFAAHAAHVQV